MQAERLEVLEHDAAVPVHDRLGQSGGSRRIQDPERVVERHLVELRPQPAAARGSGSAPRLDHASHGVTGTGSASAAQPVADVVDRDHDWPGRASAAAIAATSGRRSNALAVVDVAVDRDQHLRRDLGEPVDHGASAPKSGEHEVQIAPRLAVASRPISACGEFGR